MRTEQRRRDRARRTGFPRGNETGTFRRLAGTWTGILAAFLSAHAAGAGPAVSGPDAKDIINGVREQMASLQSVDADYRVRSDFTMTGKVIDSAVSYVRDGAKYHIVDRQRDTAADTTEERRMVHNGEVVKLFEARSRPLQPLSGQIRPGYSHGQFVMENDLLKISGFSMTEEWFEKNQDRFTFDLLGTERMGELDTWKIRIRMPYKPGHEACNYYWISQDNSGYRLWRALALVDDQPEQVLFEKRFTYGAATSLLPTAVVYSRHEPDEQSGKSTLRYTKTVEVTRLSVNQPIDPIAFEFDFPDGTSVLDTVARGSHVVGEADRQVSRQPTPPVPPPPPEPQPAEDTPASQEIRPASSRQLDSPPAKASAWPWLACAALVAGGGIGAMLVWRGRRRS